MDNPEELEDVYDGRDLAQRLAEDDPTGSHKTGCITDGLFDAADAEEPCNHDWYGLQDGHGVFECRKCGALHR